MDGLVCSSVWLCLFWVCCSRSKSTTSGTSCRRLAGKPFCTVSAIGMNSCSGGVGRSVLLLCSHRHSFFFFFIPFLLEDLGPVGTCNGGYTPPLQQPLTSGMPMVWFTAGQGTSVGLCSVCGWQCIAGVKYHSLLLNIPAFILSYAIQEDCCELLEVMRCKGGKHRVGLRERNPPAMSPPGS